MRDLVGRSPHGDTAFAADSATASLRGRGLRVRGPRLHRRAGGLRLAGSAAFRCSDRALRRGTSNDPIRFDACTDLRPRRCLGNDGTCDPDRFRCWGRELSGGGHRRTRGLEHVASSAAAKGRRAVRRLRRRGPRGRGVPHSWFLSRAVHRRRRTPVACDAALPLARALRLADLRRTRYRFGPRRVRIPPGASAFPTGAGPRGRGCGRCSGRRCGRGARVRVAEQQRAV